MLKRIVLIVFVSLAVLTGLLHSRSTAKLSPNVVANTFPDAHDNFASRLFLKRDTLAHNKSPPSSLAETFVMTLGWCKILPAPLKTACRRPA